METVPLHAVARSLRPAVAWSFRLLRRARSGWTSFTLPENTWKGRPNGLVPTWPDARRHEALVQSLPWRLLCRRQSPGHAFRWKNSIGDLAQRPGHWNLWGYRSTDGLGYHEYLQMCEDIGAEPLFVINCGMSRRRAGRPAPPRAEPQGYVQDALDAIEYANGPADSRWGSLRVKAGHPAPFKLRHMEIGNENSGPVYEDHYRQFYDAIKAKYPEMILVANTPVQYAADGHARRALLRQPRVFHAQRHPLRRLRPQEEPEDLCRRVRGNAELRQGQPAGGRGRSGLHDRHGTELGHRGHGLLRPLVRQLRLAAMEPRRHQFRQFTGLWHPFVPCAKDVQCHRGDRVLGLDFQAPRSRAQ